MKKEINLSLAGKAEPKVWGGLWLLIGSSFLWMSLGGGLIKGFQSLPAMIFFMIGLTMCLIALWLIFKKYTYKLIYDEETITFVNEKELSSVKIKDIIELEPYSVDFSNPRASYHKLYLCIKTKHEEIDFCVENFKMEEIIQMYHDIKEINDSIEDKYFKYIKYGMFTPPNGWLEFNEESKKRKFK